MTATSPIVSPALAGRLSHPAFVIACLAVLAGASFAKAEPESIYPLRPGTRWTYTNSKKTKITVAGQVRTATKEGTVEDVVVGPSPLSTERRPVMELRRTVEERGASLGKGMTVESSLHLSSTSKDAWLHRIDAMGQSSGEFDPPRPVFSDPPVTAPTASEGPMRTVVAIKEQSRERVTVPAGTFDDALKVVAEGTVSGRMGELPIRSGTIRTTAWFVPRVGVVREDRVLDLRIAIPNGAEGTAFEEGSKVLDAYSIGGETRADVAPAKKKSTNLVFVLLSKAGLPKAGDLEQAFDRFTTVKGQRLQVKKVHPAALELELSGGETAFVGLMPFAVPDEEADVAASFSLSALGTGWKLPPHDAHLAVTVDDVDGASPMEKLSQLTSVVAAVAESSNAVGVYWGGAGATHDPKFFTRIAADHYGDARIMLWMGIGVRPEDDDRLTLLSKGMKQLGLPELLLVAPQSGGKDTTITFFELLDYVAQRGKALPEGDTVGRTADERLPVSYVPSPIDPDVKVWRVELK